MRPFPVSWLTLLFLAVAPLSVGNAQDARPVEPGARLRVTRTADAEPVVGVLASLEGERLILDIGEGRRLTLAAGSITKLEASSGQKSNALLGLGIGAVVGAIGGVVYCKNAVCDQEAKAAAIFSLPGALIGVLIGAAIKTEKWEEVPLDQLRVSFVPQRDGRFGLGLSVAF